MPLLHRSTPLLRRPIWLLRTLLTGLALIGLLSGCDEPPRPTVNLYHAVHSADLDQIKRHRFWKTDINQAGPDGRYPLHVAVSQGRVVIARELLKQGAKLDARDALGRTPLHVALANGKTQAAQLLLKHGAEDDLQALLFDLANEQALDPDSIELLKSRGADLNATDPEGHAPLHRAVAAANLKLAKQLISAGANVNLASSSGKTTLQIAEEQDEPTLVALLEQYGAER
ncbi:MAG: ankyrin repeat domain-containing protein [Lamprobacter sp.]|uniref:ankyrin repeat domain-containing protein n=1 Tax=Lamprobacter sp. TaxID=3100796 RepID=UPI002B2644CD|nr:ankyrin repeat domain-containing protein [Lamprobacter sp.]MEA3640560.1 ankyrin repeat domain-containing protein [Lamprobacter sp.]